jgi:hypothetical protein
MSVLSARKTDRAPRRCFRKASYAKHKALTFPECANTFGRELIEEKLSSSFDKPQNPKEKGYKKTRKPFMGLGFRINQLIRKERISSVIFLFLFLFFGFANSNRKTFL